ncbi:MAG TPA: response regulator [Gemmatimonadales bacterium]
MATDLAPTRPVVLVVAPEDAPPVALSPDQYAIMHVPSGTLAVDWARDLRPDAMIVEAELPETSGLEVCRQLHADFRLGHNVPILMVGRQKPTAEQRAAAISAGAWDFVRWPGDSRELALMVRAYVRAKRNIDVALAEDLADPPTGVHTRSALARRARELGAMMARTRGALACVVFAVDGEPPDPRTGGIVALAARVSDVVGALGASEFAVIAPSTDGRGAVSLAGRVGRTLREASGTRRPIVPGSTLWAGYHAVANLKYAPVDPVELLRRAASAVRTGTREPDCPWLRRADGSAAAPETAARLTLPGRILDKRG